MEFRSIDRALDSFGLQRPLNVQIHGHRPPMDPSALRTTTPLEQEEDGWGMLIYSFFFFCFNLVFLFSLTNSDEEENLWIFIVFLWQFVFLHLRLSE